MNSLRKYIETDRKKILELYKRVAENIGGIARTNDEINQVYIDHIIGQSIKSGIQILIDHPSDSDKLIGEIHCYKLEPSVFEHVLSELTIVVDKDFQEKGIGKALFNELLRTIENERTDILRVELVVRESNQRAIEFYKSLGFKIEGKLENRIDLKNGTFEADIPMAWMNKNYGISIG